MDKRPALDPSISIKDFKEFYWLKSELQSFCKEVNIPSSGGKIDVAARIEQYLKTGTYTKIKRNKISSSFDWKTASLSLDTIITDSYRNTENVRSFFKEQIGPSFKFNVVWMNWLKEHIGSTLRDAISAYHQIKKHHGEKNIAPQFEYNKYMKDCKAHYPELSHQDVVKMWNTKRSRRGENVFNPADVVFLK